MHPERVQQKGIVMSIYSEIFIHNLFHPFRVTKSVRLCFLLSYSQLRRVFRGIFMKYLFYFAIHSFSVKKDFNGSSLDAGVVIER